MKKYIGLLLIIFSSIVRVNGQSAELALREYYVDAEFFLAQEFFADALHDYMEVYKRGYKDNANINYKIGKCYLYIPGKKDHSIEYLEKAKAFASNKYRGAALTEKFAPIDVYLYLGNAYRVNNMLDKAIESYKAYKSLIPAEEDKLQKFADKQIEACNIAFEFMNSPKNVEFQNLGKEVNSNNDDFKAVVSGDGNSIFFMHKLPFYDAVSVSRRIDGKWSRPENITPQIMSDGNQYVCCVSYDGMMLILTKEDEFNSDLYFTRYVDNRWTPSEPLKGTDINTKYWESHASISKDGKLLYFTSNRKGGIGEMDIYVSKLGSNDVWGGVSNLGPKINTELNEDTPFITEDGKTLYFSSQSYANMGGYDYFYSHMEGDTAWSVPENLGFPYSTTDDDLFFFPYNNGKVGYISRIMSDGSGGMDIYRVGEKEALMEPITESTIPAETQPVPMPIDTIKPVAAVVNEVQEPAVVEQVTPPATVAETTVPAVVEETTVPAVIEETVAPVIAEEKPAEKPVEEVAKVAVVKTYEITPLLFEFDKASITEAGKIELDKIIALMKENPAIEVVISGFADALGPDDYNIRLSEKRALQTLAYIVQKGIDAKRLKAIGKGEVEFIAPNTKADGSDYPEGRKYNRRVEFEITGADSKLLIIRRIDPVPITIKSQER